MTARERFLKTMNFEKPDRLPMIEWASWWDKTIERWKEEGLTFERPEGLTEGEAIQLHMGLDLNIQCWIGFKTKETPKPAHHGAPIITSMEEYEAIKHTLYPDPAARLNPERMKFIAEKQAKGEAIVWITQEGPFWGPRSLLGIEEHLYAFYDEPELMHQINKDLTEYNMRVYQEVCKYFIPDFMTIAEDMSYNNGPMLSGDHFREFIAPYYKRLIPEIKKYGTKVFVDSDGDVSLMLPWLIEAGVEGILPLERQAGVDLNAYREKYPDFMFIGGFDKMCLLRGKEDIRKEFERLLPVIESGRYIPSVDHQTPPGTTLENYRYYVELLHEYCKRSCKACK